jgi:hypothetical protein
LLAHGWRPIVLRVHERCYVEPADEALARLVPADLQQVRTGAFPARFARLAGVGDIGLRAWPHLAHALERMISRERPDLVFITGAPFYPMLLAGGVRRRGVAVVLDFQDPWVSDYGASARFGSKAWLAHSLAVALEPRAVRRASFITSVSEIQNEEMAARYPWLDQSRMEAIPIGGDPADFEMVRERTVAFGMLDPARVNLSCIGTYPPRAGPLIESLFQALASLRDKTPELAARLRLNFVGTSARPVDGGNYHILPYARAVGVEALVRETPRRQPYLEALSLMANSDALLLIGSPEPHYTASRIYPTLISGRPWLSLYHRSSSAHRILETAGGGWPIAFASGAELQATVPALAEAMRRLASGSFGFGKVKSEVISSYMASAIAGRFAAIFDRASKL